MTDDERGRVGRAIHAEYVRESPMAIPWDAMRLEQRMLWFNLGGAAIAAMREGEQKQEGEARAAGEITWHRCHGRIVTYPSVLCSMHRHQAGMDDPDFDPVEALQAAESLAKAEREGRESEATAYRNEIEQLKRERDVARGQERAAWAMLTDPKCMGQQPLSAIAAVAQAANVYLQDYEQAMKAQKVRVLAERAESAEKECDDWHRERDKLALAYEWLEKERDAALTAKAEADRICEHWRNLACDPQTRENINAEKVAECERLRAALVELATWAEGAVMIRNLKAGMIEQNRLADAIMACQTCDGSGMIEVEGEYGRGGSAEFTRCPECSGKKTT